MHPSLIKLFEDIVRMLTDLFKTKFHLMSLSFCSNDHRIISLSHPLPFESVCFVVVVVVVVVFFCFFFCCFFLGGEVCAIEAQ